MRGRAADSAAADWAVVPVKPFALAKGRLAPLLEPAERAMLARAMMQDTLAVLGATALAGTLVVTDDEAAAALARAGGAAVLPDAGGSGINGAVEAAARHLARHGAAGMIVVPSDIPELCPGTVNGVAALLGRRSAVIVPAIRDGGTNLLGLAPAQAIPPRFGPDSARRHAAAARAAGIAPVEIAPADAGRDLDRPEDVAAFLARPTPTHTHAVLTALGIPARLARGSAWRGESRPVAAGAPA